MEKEDINEFTDAKILNSIKQFESEKDQQLIRLIIEIIITSTLNEYHEESDKIFKVQQPRPEQ